MVDTVESEILKSNIIAPKAAQNLRAYLVPQALTRLPVASPHKPWLCKDSATRPQEVMRKINRRAFSSVIRGSVWFWLNASRG